MLIPDFAAQGSRNHRRAIGMSGAVAVHLVLLLLLLSHLSNRNPPALPSPVFSVVPLAPEGDPIAGDAAPPLEWHPQVASPSLNLSLPRFAVEEEQAQAIQTNSPADEIGSGDAADNSGDPKGSVVKEDYFHLLVRHLQHYTHVQRRGEIGLVALRLTLTHTGRLIGAKIVKSSGIGALDKEALEVVKRAQPLPIPPASMVGDPIALVIPMKFESVADAVK